MDQSKPDVPLEGPLAWPEVRSIRSIARCRRIVVVPDGRDEVDLEDGDVVFTPDDRFVIVPPGGAGRYELRSWTRSDVPVDAGPKARR